MSVRFVQMLAARSGWLTRIPLSSTPTTTSRVPGVSFHADSARMPPGWVFKSPYCSEYSGSFGAANACSRPFDSTARTCGIASMVAALAWRAPGAATGSRISVSPTRRSIVAPACAAISWACSADVLASTVTSRRLSAGVEFGVVAAAKVPCDVAAFVAELPDFDAPAGAGIVNVNDATPLTARMVTRAREPRPERMQRPFCREISGTAVPGLRVERPRLCRPTRRWFRAIPPKNWGSPFSSREREAKQRRC